MFKCKTLIGFYLPPICREFAVDFSCFLSCDLYCVKFIVLSCIKLFVVALWFFESLTIVAHEPGSTKHLSHEN